MEQQRCPNCGRKLAEEELYCYFCELEISGIRKKEKRENKKH